VSGGHYVLWSRLPKYAIISNLKLMVQGTLFCYDCSPIKWKTVFQIFLYFIVAEVVRIEKAEFIIFSIFYLIF
jgi:hypothetical protein